MTIDYSPYLVVDADRVDAILRGPNGPLLFVACNSGIEMASSIKGSYEAMLRARRSDSPTIPLLGTADFPVTRAFADGETCPRLGRHVAGSDTFVFQCVHERQSGRTPNENLQQMLQVVTTLNAHRAARITVVVPYAPYSRQEKPTYLKREASLARLFMDQLSVAGADGIVTYHAHTLSLAGLCQPALSFVALSGLDLFADVFQHLHARPDVVVVSTDEGGAKQAVHFARKIGVAYAIGSKLRSGSQTQHLGLIGDLAGKKVALILDDETVTAGSLVNVARALHGAGVEEIRAAVSHAKLVDAAIPLLVDAHERLGLRSLHVTDSIPQTQPLLGLPFLKVHSIADRLAITINRLHHNRSVSEVAG